MVYRSSEILFLLPDVTLLELGFETIQLFQNNQKSVAVLYTVEDLRKSKIFKRINGSEELGKSSSFLWSGSKIALSVRLYALNVSWGERQHTDLKWNSFIRSISRDTRRIHWYEVDYRLWALISTSTFIFAYDLSLVLNTVTHKYRTP